jgi:hypothetical protein
VRVEHRSRICDGGGGGSGMHSGAGSHTRIMYFYVFLILIGVINERCERCIALSSVIGLRMYSPILGYSCFLKLTVGQVFLDREKIYQPILERSFDFF